MRLFSTRRLLFCSSKQSQAYGALRFTPQVEADMNNTKVDKLAQDVYKWAKMHNVKYYSFWTHPHTGSIAEKQERFIGVQDNKQGQLRKIFEKSLTGKQLLRGEGDGSSFPNGGIRETSAARSYMLWDHKSDLFIRKKQSVLYIPALLVAQNGDALDDKTPFRKAQKALEQATIKLLARLNVPATSASVVVGLEQQFFAVPSQMYYNRIDLTQSGRTLVGEAPPRGQQFSDHYYGKLENRILAALTACQQELAQLGLPIKTRHKEVAPNQYEFCSLHETAGAAIDHNLLKMEIMKEVFEEHGLVPLFHEKPFRHFNGSGKHINWSLKYMPKGKKDSINLFDYKPETEQHFTLFTLLALKALLNNHRLFLSAIACPGNEIRLGGHEAPPRIISAYLGKFIHSVVYNLGRAETTVDLKNILPILSASTMAETTDRNRTSPYAYTSDRFEFRAVGSSQNPTFPITVITASYAETISEAAKGLESGVTVEDMIKQLRLECQKIVFEGNGYSKEWEKEAKKRGLEVLDNFSDGVGNLAKNSNVFIRTGVYNQSELDAKQKVEEDRYIQTVLVECDCLISIINKNILPRAEEIITKLPKNSTSAVILKRTKEIEAAYESVVKGCSDLVSKSNSKAIHLKDAAAIRGQVITLGETVDKLAAYLPEVDHWPELHSSIRTLNRPL